MKDANPERVLQHACKSEQALFLWLLAVICPASQTDFKYGAHFKSHEKMKFPDVIPYPVSLCPPLNNCLHECRNNLTSLTLGVPAGMDGLAVQVLRHLRTSTSLKELYLPGYAAAAVSEVPADWATDGRLPTWMKEKLGVHRKHWQILNLRQHHTSYIKCVVPHRTLCIFRERRGGGGGGGG